VRDGCPLPGLGAPFGLARRFERRVRSPQSLGLGGTAQAAGVRVQRYAGRRLSVRTRDRHRRSSRVRHDTGEEEVLEAEELPCTLSIRLSNLFTLRSNALNGSVADALVARPTPRTPTHSATVRTVRFIAIPSFRLLSTPTDPCTIMPSGRGREQTEKYSGIPQRPHISPRYLWLQYRRRLAPSFSTS
jgi:hypothetical protein